MEPGEVLEEKNLDFLQAHCVRNTFFNALANRSVSLDALKAAFSQPADTGKALIQEVSAPFKMPFVPPPPIQWAPTAFEFGVSMPKPPPAGPELGSPEMPTVGSMLH